MDHLVILINSSVSFDSLILSLNDLIDVILSKYPVTLTMSLDGMTNSIYDCHKIYSSSYALLYNRFILGDNQLIYKKRIMDKISLPVNFPDKLIEEITRMLQSGNEKAFRKNLVTFFDIIKNYTWQTAYFSYAKLKMECINIIQKLSNYEMFEQLPITYQAEAQTIEKAYDQIVAFYHDYQNFKKQCINNVPDKHQLIVNECKQYIEEHYSTYDLCKEHIAMHFGYSSNYFAKVFYSITHITITDYIRQCRISKAQILLTQTDMTINDITKSIGFTNSNYFYSLFKKETGLTPSQYREIK